MSNRITKHTAFIEAIIQHKIRFSHPPSEPLHEIGEFHIRHILGTCYPKSKEEVLIIITLANRYSAPLYPISIGKNWGFGSFVPVNNNCFVVDLSGMDKISDINLDTGVAIIEPGVTQAQLSKKLHGTPYLLNVTASSPNSSIIGNALERGIGQFRNRVEDILGVEIILGREETVQWGGFPNVSPCELPYSYGIGPNLISLAFQSNFGIVTEAAIALIPRTEHTVIFQLNFKTADFLKVYEAIQKLFREKLLDNNVKILQGTNDHLNLISGIRGRKQIVEIAKQLINTALKDLGVLEFQDSKSILNASHPLQNYLDLINGVPRFLIDVSLSVENNEDLDHSSETGIRLLTFVLPTNPQNSNKVFSLARAHALFNTELMISSILNIRTSNETLLHLYLCFPRNTKNIQKANTRTSEMIWEFMRLGCYPYRIDIDQQHLNFLKANKPTKAVIQDIKATLDPKNIISPGRYQFD